tara:strand:+ start:53 stop:322 length:270 start_codon:yes stop_codon:yes gene_type:complete
MTYEMKCRVPYTNKYVNIVIDLNTTYPELREEIEKGVKFLVSQNGSVEHITILIKIYQEVYIEYMNIVTISPKPPTFIKFIILTMEEEE